MKVKILVLSAFILLFISCSSNDDGVVTTTASIVGTWNLQSQTINGMLTTEVDGQQVSIAYTTASKNHNFKLIFSENPNIVKGEGTYTLVSTASFLGQTQTDEQVVDGANVSNTYRLSGNTVTFVESGNTTVFTIKELTNTSLKLEGTLDENISFQGKTPNLKGTMKVEYTK